MAKAINETTIQNPNTKEPASCRAGNAFAELRQISLSRKNRLSHSNIPLRVIGHTRLAKTLSGMVFVAVLLSTFVAWHMAFSQQPHARSYPAPDFTVVVLPDTQYYTDEIRGATMRMFTAQTQWVADNKTRENIRAVIGLGDIVDNGDASAEWQKADSAYRILDRAAVPYAPVLGNHDYDTNLNAGNRAARNYNTYFGPSRFLGYSWYGGGYPAGSNENFYITFTAGTRSYLVIALEYYPRTNAVQWAQRVVDGNPDKEVIITTHSYLDDDGRRIVKGGRHGPQSDGLASDNDNDAEELWAKFVKKNKNIILVVSGHVCQGISIMARRSDEGDNGNLVHQLLADYQWLPNGGNGYMRIMKFRPSKRIIEVRTYSPYLKAFMRDASNQFTLKYVGQNLHQLPAGRVPTHPQGAPAAHHLLARQLGPGTARAVAELGPAA